MKGYRLFILAADGNVQGVVEILCAGDDAALSRAGQQPHRHGAELWRGSRCIHVFAPAG